MIHVCFHLYSFDAYEIPLNRLRFIELTWIWFSCHHLCSPPPPAASYSLRFQLEVHLNPEAHSCEVFAAHQKGLRILREYFMIRFKRLWHPMIPYTIWNVCSFDPRRLHSWYVVSPISFCENENCEREKILGILCKWVLKFRWTLTLVSCVLCAFVFALLCTTITNYATNRFNVNRSLLRMENDSFNFYGSEHCAPHDHTKQLTSSHIIWWWGGRDHKKVEQ